MKDWKKEALSLAFSTTLSWRAIAKKLGKSKSTVSDLLRKAKEENYLHTAVVKDNLPKVLLFDIETSMIKAYVWNLWKQDIHIKSIIEDWYLLCYSAKWLGTDEIIHDSLHLHGTTDNNFKEYEFLVVQSLWSLLDEADILIAYNGKSFDRKKMNTKFLEYGLPEPTPYKVIDPMLIIKGNFAFTSNKMDFAVRYTEDYENGKHSTDLSLWHKAMAGDVEALDYMLSYCDQDINVLEKVYLAVRHWDKNAPNMALLYGDNKPRCNGCGSDDLSPLENKSFHTTLSKFSILRCNGCGKILRDRKNTLSKEKRDSLLMNA